MTQGNSIAVAVSDKVNEDIREALSKESIKFIIPKKWYEFSIFALRFSSPVSMGLTAQQFKDLYQRLNKHKTLTCFEFAGINNKLEELTSVQFSIDLENYIEFQIIMENLAKAWNEQTSSIRQEILDKVMEGAKNIQRG